MSKLPLENVVDLLFEGHDAARGSEDPDEAAGNQSDVQMQLEQGLAHASGFSLLGLAYFRYAGIGDSPKYP
jgi:hypothetical protein